MSAQEANLLIDAHNIQYKEEWEKTRWLAYIIAASNGAKVKKPQDLIKFNWETQSSRFEDTRTEEQKKASLDKMKQKIMQRKEYLLKKK